MAGNALLVAPTVLVLIALTWAGARNPSASYQILVPLILGLVGLAGFFVLEGSTWVPELVMFVSPSPLCLSFSSHILTTKTNLENLG